MRNQMILTESNIHTVVKCSLHKSDIIRAVLKSLLGCTSFDDALVLKQFVYSEFPDDDKDEIDTLLYNVVVEIINKEGIETFV